MDSVDPVTLRPVTRRRTRALMLPTFKGCTLLSDTRRLPQSLHGFVLPCPDAPCDWPGVYPG